MTTKMVEKTIQIAAALVGLKPEAGTDSSTRLWALRQLVNKPLAKGRRSMRRCVGKEMYIS